MEMSPCGRTDGRTNKQVKIELLSQWTVWDWVSQLSYYHQRTKISKTQLSANWIFIQFQAIIACTAFLRVKIFDWKCFDFYDFKNLHIKISLFSSLCCFSDFVHFVALWLPHHLLLDSLWQQKNITNCFPSEDYKYAPSTNIIECQTLGWHYTGPI